MEKTLRITRNHLPDKGWKIHKPRGEIRAVRVKAPFLIAGGKGTEPCYLTDHYVYIDSAGFPAVMSIAEFEAIYKT